MSHTQTNTKAVHYFDGCMQTHGNETSSRISCTGGNGHTPIAENHNMMSISTPESENQVLQGVEECFQGHCELKM